MTDITVVGGGVVGLATAREFCMRGARVTLLERGITGQQASWAGGGILSPLHPWRYPSELLALAHWSQEIYPDYAARLAQETNLDPEWTKSGLLILDDGEMTEAEQWGTRWNMTLEVLQGTALRNCEPSLNPVVERAIYLPDIAQVRNPRLLAALRRSLELSGVTIIEQTEVTGFETRGDRVVGVRTPSTTISTENVLVTAGAWSGRLLEGLNIEIPIEPVRGQMLLFKGPVGEINRVILKGARYVIPRRDGRVLVGSTIEHSGFDDSITRDARDDLTSAGHALVPGLEEAVLEHHWAGLRPGSPRGVPFIGRHPGLDGLFLNAGHFRNGLMLAPAAAKLVADIVEGKQPMLDVAPYALNRPA